MIYLDHNATSPLRPSTQQKLLSASYFTCNPSSVHAGGREARALVEQAHEKVAALAGARAEDVIFTGSGAEANALALWGAIYGAVEAEARFARIFVSAIEHPSVIDTAAAVAERVAGVRMTKIPVTAEGVIDAEALRVMLREGKGRTLVCTMAVNNETGVVQPLDVISKHVREAGASLLVDGVQAAGKIPLPLDWDYLTLSGHKLGALQGVGALIVKDGVPFAPMSLGGGQERGRRAGTENVVGIASFSVVTGVDFQIAKLAALRDHLEAELLRRWPETVIFGRKAPRISNTSNFAIPGVSAETAMIALDLDGICVSSGSACSSGKVKASHVLTAMGVPHELAACALRASFGWTSLNAISSEVDGLGHARALLTSLEKFVSRAHSRAVA